MTIQFTEERWDRIRESARLWWQGQLGRPLIQVRLSNADPLRDEPDIPFHDFTSFYDLSVSAERIIDRWDYDLSATRFYGDAFPHVRPNFGPGVIAAFMGAVLENGLETVWFHPLEDVQLKELTFKYQTDSIWFNRIIELIRACDVRWGGMVQIGLTDLGGNLDILSSFRTPEQLIYDIIDSPEEVERLLWEAHDAWWRYADAFNDEARNFNPGYTCWTPLYSEDPYYMLQCDFCYMIGPDMFERFVRPELAATVKRLGNAFYHMDGIGQIPHLEYLLSIEALKGIQWVPGDGRPDVAHWPEIYCKIQSAGKLTQFFSDQCDDTDKYEILEILGDQTGTVNNIAYILDADISEFDKAMRLLEKFGVSP